MTTQAGPTPPDGMLAELAEGLRQQQKSLSPKWFYDHRGSRLFEEITRLPEYYPTRSERALLRSFAPTWIGAVAPRALVELGAGAAEKTRILLDAMQRASPGATYVPVDISGEFLSDAARTLANDYRDLQIRPVAADISVGVPLPEDLPHPVVVALLGGTIGNFSRRAAGELLGRAADHMRGGDRFLLGADLVKDVAVLERAYNDSAGVTAAFNLNALEVLNRVAGADFDPSAFRHHAFYNEEEERIEMHLVAEHAMTVRIAGAGSFSFAAGESLMTEISRKYSRERVEQLFGDAGLVLERWIEGPNERERFGLAVGRRP